MSDPKPAQSAESVAPHARNHAGRCAESGCPGFGTDHPDTTDCYDDEFCPGFPFYDAPDYEDDAL